MKIFINILIGIFLIIPMSYNLHAQNYNNNLQLLANSDQAIFQNDYSDSLEEDKEIYIFLYWKI